MSPFAIPEGTPEETRRYLMLEAGREREWFDFTSTNPPGFVDHQGVKHAGRSYSLKLRDGTPIVLAEWEVEGFVYCTALMWEQVDAITYRPGMEPTAPDDAHEDATNAAEPD